MAHICILGNSKNRFGGYTGRAYTRITIMPNGNREMVSNSEQVDYGCDRLTFREFTELSQ